MTMKNVLLPMLITSLVIAAGCATNVPKELVATGGSRSDGTVEMSFEHYAMEQPQVDYAKGLEVARMRCAKWGYSDAEQFGGVSRTCQSATQYGCGRWLAKMTYQCLGTPTT